MNAKTMEDLAGAGTNMNLLNTPMRVYKEAERRGNLSLMERAADYAGRFASKAHEYQKKAEEGMKEEAEEFKEKVRLDQEKAKEAREKKKIETEKMTKQRKEEAEQAEQVTENTQAADTVELSEEGKQMLAETESVSVKEPVIYTSAGEGSHAVQKTEINISI